MVAHSRATLLGDGGGLRDGDGSDKCSWGRGRASYNSSTDGIDRATRNMSGTIQGADCIRWTASPTIPKRDAVGIT